jgi:hypothetical protein
LRAVRSRPVRKGGRQTSAKSKSSGLSDGSRQILDAVRKNPSGMQSEEFARAIGSPSPSSVPVRMMMLGKELIALGFKPEDVVNREKIYVKGRGKSRFKPGARLEDVLRRNGDLFAIAK